MSLNSSELQSIADQLTNLGERISKIVEEADPDDPDFNNVSEIERQLMATGRRLVKFVNQ